MKDEAKDPILYLSYLCIFIGVSILLYVAF